MLCSSYCLLTWFGNNKHDYNKMKEKNNITHHQSIFKSNLEIVETGAKSISLTHIYITAHLTHIYMTANLTHIYMTVHLTHLYMTVHF